jgi:hypothetical protein
VNREKRESLRTGEPIHYETTAIAQHKHGQSWHEHDWSEGDGHSHGGTMRQPAEPTGEVIGEHPTRLMARPSFTIGGLHGPPIAVGSFRAPRTCVAGSASLLLGFLLGKELRMDRLQLRGEACWVSALREGL